MPTPSPTQRLALAAKQYMAGEMSLRDYQAITRELTPDYAHASMQVASWGWLGRLLARFDTPRSKETGILGSTSRLARAGLLQPE
jgi:hypothetical protein